MPIQNITTTTQTDSTSATQYGMTVTNSTTTQTVGSTVTDVTVSPYIAPVIIAFIAYNMRPLQRMHIFFDSVIVDQYCAPGTVPFDSNGKPIIADPGNFWSVTPTNGWGTPIYSDANGFVAGWFNIPAAKFKTGDRLLVITDVDSITKGTDAATTTSSATFTASNLNVTKAAITLTTVNPQLSFSPISSKTFVTNEHVIGTNVNYTLPDIGVVSGSWYEPIAQGLTINTPNQEAGVFVTGIRLYFKQKSQFAARGVSVYICETNNGYPNGSKVIPFSQTYLPYNAINISQDASVGSLFRFDSPVFLNNGVEYAFVVKPDAGDPDYFVYSAVLGDLDILTGKQMFGQPVLGTAFYGATEGEWTALQTEYIKFDLLRAVFEGANGEAYFVNSNTDYLSVYNVNYSSASAGIQPGDYAFQSTNSTVNTNSYATGGTVNTNVYGLVSSYDDVKGILYISSSTGNFLPNTYVQIHRFANSTVRATPGPNTSTYIASANTGSLYDPKINALVPQVATMAPSGTSISWSYNGASNSYTLDTQEYNVNSGTEIELYDYERIVASHSNQLTKIPGSSPYNKSFKLHAHMTTDSNFLSPVVDTVRKQQLLLANEIEPVSFIYDEFFNYGTSKSKYVSQIVTLASGQDAEDLQVILSAFRPAGSDIQVWVKFLNGEDSDNISMKTWVPMYNASPTLFSNPSNVDDLKEFVFTVPKFYGMIPTSGLVTVEPASSACTVITGLSTYFGDECKIGWYINMLANSTFQETSRKIISIDNHTQMTIDQPFNAADGYTGQPYFVVPPPTAAWLSTNNVVSLTGTVDVSTTTNIITGHGTNFTGQLLIGSTIQVNGDQQVIVSITNSTSLAVGTPWTSTATGQSAYYVSPQGVSYLNSTGGLYASFKQFQIKIILQTNDSSQVPQIHDIRALALQL